ncbi:Venom carboxylesterase-6, partial [Orchesella cincta]
MDCYRAANPHFLIHAQQKLYDFMTFPPILFAPVVERPGPEAFLTDTPENMYSKKLVQNIPWICAQTTEEGESFALAFKHVGKIPFYKRNFDRVAPYILDYWYVAKNSSEVTAKIRDVYFGTEGPNPSAESIRIVSDLVSDRYFRVGIHRAIALHSKIAPTYASLFGFRSQIGFPSLWGDSPNDYGVGHASDNGFYFNSTLYFLPLQLGTPSYDVSRMLINLAVNFAKKREPFLNYRNGNVIKIWKPAMYHGKDLRFLLIDNENVIMIPEPRQYAIRFWESLGLADTPVTMMSTAEPNPHQATDLNALGVQAPAPPIPPSIDNYAENYNAHYMQPEYSTYVAGFRPYFLGLALGQLCLKYEGAAEEVVNELACSGCTAAAAKTVSVGGIPSGSKFPDWEFPSQAVAFLTC